MKRKIEQTVPDGPAGRAAENTASEKVKTAKAKPAKARAKADAQSMVNNINCIPDGKYNASQAKFYLRRLRQLQGASEQFLLVQLLLAGFEVSPVAAPYREKIRREWQDSPLNDVELIEI